MRQLEGLTGFRLGAIAASVFGSAPANSPESVALRGAARPASSIAAACCMFVSLRPPAEHSWG